MVEYHLDSRERSVCAEKAVEFFAKKFLQNFKFVTNFVTNVCYTEGKTEEARNQSVRTAACERLKGEIV